MIFGTGIDITTIGRFEKWIGNKSLCGKYFSNNELEYIFSKGKDSVQSLAAGFAAKEAFGKALGTGMAGMNLKNVSIVRDKLGKPGMILTGNALEKLKSCGSNPRVHLSISHESEWAIAQVIIEVDNV